MQLLKIVQRSSSLMSKSINATGLLGTNLMKCSVVSDCIDTTKNLDITPIIKKKLNEQFQPTELTIKDLSEGYNQLLEIRIVSPLFKDMSVIQRHRKLNKALSDEMKLVHGISFIPLVPEDQK